MSRKLGIFLASAGLGLLLGALAGLSVSPVVSTIVGVFAPFGVAFAAWIGTKRDPSVDPAEYYAAVGGLSWAAVLGLVLGLLVRTHSWLSPTPLQVEKRWEAAGLSPADAQAEARAELGSVAASSTTAKPVNPVSSDLFSRRDENTQFTELQAIVDRGNLDSIEKSFVHYGSPLSEPVVYVEGQKMAPADATKYLQKYYRWLAAQPSDPK